MINFDNDILTKNEIVALASIVQVGNATYYDLLKAESPMFRHPYLTDIKGRVRTKLVQMECEIESHDDKFPFEFTEREFCYGHKVPELRNKYMVIHIAQSTSPTSLPNKADYKYDLTFNNDPLCRQMKMDFSEEGKFVSEFYYGILVFGGKEGKLFCRLQFPEPGYETIADYIDIPMVSLLNKKEETKKFERKKAVLREEFIAQGIKKEAL